MRHPEYMTTRASSTTYRRRHRLYVPHCLTMLVVIMLSLGSAVAAYGKGSDITAPYPVVNQQQGKEFAVASAVDADGNVIVAGYQTLPGSSYYDFYTVKFKSDGSGLMWHKTFGSAAISEQISGMAIDGEGNIIVTGTVLNASDRDIITIKYDKTNGDILWKGVYQGTGEGSGNDYSTAVTVDSANNVYVAGYSLVNRKYDYLVLKYASNNPPLVDATPVLVKTYNHATVRQDHKANAIAVGADGSFIVTGDSSNGTDYDCLTVKFDQAGGFVWENRVSSPNSKADSGRHVKIDAEGNVIVAGYVTNITDTDMFTTKYLGSTGVMVWDARYNSGFRDEPSALVVDTSRDVYVTGFSHGHRYTAKYSRDAKTGTQESVLLWDHFFDSGIDTSDVPTGLAVDETTDGLFVTGYIQADGGTLPDYDVLTAKYSKTTGHMLWQKSSRDALNSAGQPVVLDGQPIGVGMPLLGSLDVSVGGWTIRPLETGSAEATAALRTTTIYDPTKNWTVSQAGKYVKVTSGLNAGMKRAIITNPDNIENGNMTLTVEPAFPNPVATGDNYYLFDPSDFDFFVMKYDKGILDPPTNLKATTLPSTKIKLTWEDNSTNEAGFRIERCKGKDCTDFLLLDTVALNAVTYDDLSELDPETYYSYRVMSYMEGTDSYPSNVSHALTHYVDYHVPSNSFIYNNTITNNDDQALSIAMGPDNNPIVTGSTYTPDGGSDYLTVKLNKENLSSIWTQRYTSSYIQSDIPTCITVDNNGQAIISGYSYQPGGAGGNDTYALYTIKYLFSPAPPPEADVTRIREWADSYHGPAGLDDRATAIDSTTDGQNNIVIVGYGMSASFAQNGHQNIYVIKYLANGTLDWEATPFDGGGDDVPVTAAFDSDGNVIVVGRSEKGYMNGDFNLFVAKYCGTSIGTNCKGKAKGEIIWSDLFDGPAHVDARGSGVVVDKNGDVFVTGYVVNAAGNKDLIAIKYQGTPPASEPVKLWSGDFRFFDGLAHGDDEGVAIKLDPVDGNIVVAGTTRTDIYDDDFRIIKYDSATGTAIWEKTLQREDNDDHLVSMAMDYSGNAYLVGTTTSGLTSDILSVVYDYKGEIVGATHYNSEDNLNDGAYAITVNSVGDSFIAGYTVNEGIPASGVDPHLDYLVIKQVIDLSLTVMAPGPFKAEPQSDYRKIKLSWRENTNGTSFRVTRTNDAVVREFPSGTLEFEDTVTNPNTPYCYTIEAFIGEVKSRQLSTCATTTMDKPTLNAINLSGGVTNSSISLTWPAISGSVGFKLERSTDNINWSQIPSAGYEFAGSATSHLDSGLVSGRRYYYRLYVKTLSGFSLPSDVRDAATIPAVPVLNAPSTISSTEIRVTWPSVEGAMTFRIEYKIEPGGTWTPIPDNDLPSTQLIYNHTGLMSGTTYYYHIKSINAAGESAFSSDNKYTTTVLTPPQISAPVVVDNSASITINWNDPNSANAYPPNGNEDNFKIYYEKCIYDYPTQCDPATNVNAFQQSIWNNRATVSPAKDTMTTTLANLERGRSYRFWIVAVRGGIEAPAISPLPTANMKAAAAALAVPTLTTTINDTWIQFNWGDILGETNYRIEYADGTPISPVLDRNVTQWRWDNLTPNTTYSNVLLKATNVYDESKTPPITYTTSPGRPVMTSVDGTGQTSMLIKWTDPGTADTGWQVWRSTWNTPSTTPPATGDTGWGAWTNLHPTTYLPADTVEFTDTVSAGNYYRYKVAYRLADGTTWSAYSDPPQWAPSWPATPTSFTVTGYSATRADLAWANVNAETGYSAQQKLRTAATCDLETDWVTNTTNSNVLTNVLATSFTTPASSEIFCYRIKADNAEGSSPWTATITKLRPPSTITLGVNMQTLTVGWPDQSTENTGYRLERAIAGSGSWSTLANLGADVITYPNSGLAAGELYHYRVRTVHNNTGFSEPTAEIFARTVPATPTTLGATASPTSITLTWNVDAISGEQGYFLQYRPRGTETTCPNTTEFWSDASVKTVDKNLPTFSTHTLNSPADIDTATPYCFRLASYVWNSNLGHQPANSVYSTAIQKATVLPAPGYLTLSEIKDTSVKLTWGTVAGNYGYRIQRSTASDFTTDLKTYDVPTTPLSYVNNTDVLPAITYYYRIYTKNIIGDISQTPMPVSGGRSCLTLTSAPPAFTATAASDQQIDLSWKSVFGQIGNRIYRNGDYVETSKSYIPDYCGYPYPMVGCTTVTAPTLTYQDTGLEADTQYCYHVVALNSDGYESAQSPSTDYCLYTPKAGPAVTAEAVNGMTVNLSWSYSGPNDGFEIESQLWNGSWISLATVQNGNLCSIANKCNYEDKNGVIDPAYTDKNGVVINRIYKYRVRAYVGENKSGYGYASTSVAPFRKPVCP